MPQTLTDSIYDFDGESSEGHTVSHGIITSPGKFEGEMVYLVDAYQQYLEGFCDDDGRVVRVDFPGAWKRFKETQRRQTVAFVVDDQGFVRETR
jgi:hypothetical protein